MAGVWLLATLILGSVYRSNLKAMLILPRVRLPFDTLQELADSHIPLYSAPGNAAHQAVMVRGRLVRGKVVRGRLVRENTLDFSTWMLAHGRVTRVSG